MTIIELPPSLASGTILLLIWSSNLIKSPWKGGRVVNCNGLENRDLNGSVGSNPSPSADRQASVAGVGGLVKGGVFEHTGFATASSLSEPA